MAHGLVASQVIENGPKPSVLNHSAVPVPARNWKVRVSGLLEPATVGIQ